MQYDETTLYKVRIYFACNYLYSQGLSHPEVVAAIAEKIDDKETIVALADKAQSDLWNKIFVKTQEMTASGATFGEICTAVSDMEEDPKIIQFICNTWYAVQTEYMENFVESSGNIAEGIKGVVIASIILAVAFYAGLSKIAKIFWSVIWVLSLLLWVYGLWQKRLAKRLENVLKKDYSKYQGFL